MPRRYARRRRRRKPYRRTRRRKIRRRRTRRSRARSTTSYAVRPVARRMPMLFPDKVKIRLRYSSHFPLTGSLYVFRGNGMYDPNLSSTGHQPMGYDQWSAIYPNWYVKSSTCSVIAFPDASSTSAGQVSLIASRMSATSSPSSQQVREWPRSRWMVVPFGTSVKSTRIWSKAATRVMQPGTNIASLEGYTSADPSTQWYWKIYKHNIGGGASANMQILVTVTYDAVFYKNPVEEDSS